MSNDDPFGAISDAPKSTGGTPQAASLSLDGLGAESKGQDKSALAYVSCHLIAKIDYIQVVSSCVRIVCFFAVPGSKSVL
jgi:hypothetical protein